MTARVVTFLTRLYSDAMTPKEFQAALQRLGLSQSEAARQLRVEVRTVQRWIAGERTIPGPVISCLEAWERERRALDALNRKR